MADRLEPMEISEGATIRSALLAINGGSYEIALVVDSRRCLVGTVTDGDVRRALLAGSSLDDPVRPFVSKSPYAVGPTAGRAEVLDLMSSRAIQQVPVVNDEGVLLGLHVMRELVGVSERPNAALVLTGGRGTRLGSLTAETPKPMLPVAGRPILERIVLHLVGSGIRRVILSVGYLAEVIEDHFGDGSDFGCRVEYVREDPESPLGTGGPLGLVGQLSDPPGEPLLLMNGDLVTEFRVDELFRHHEESRALITMTYREHFHQVPYGVLDVDAGRVVALDEKPLQSWPINAGIYVVDPSLVARVPPGTALPVTDLISDCLDRGEFVGAVEIDGEWHDVGYPEHLREARGQE